MSKIIVGTRASFWIIGVLVLFLSLLSLTNLWLLLQRDAVVPVGQAETSRPVEPIFVPVGPMTVNLQDDNYGPRLLYTGFSFKVNDVRTQEALLTHMPEVRSRLLLLLSRKTAAELTAPGGKEALVEEINGVFAEPLAQGLPPLAFSAVLFTDFIVQ